MKIINYSLLVAIVFLMSSCSVVGGLLKTGIWIGIVLVVVVVGIILWIFNKGSKS